ncbi:MAG TPA: S8 family serine peptidase [Xanthomonadaceae bacterium]|nr:S8 family serine peptidase [Xanthomonadaceae bacterium]
MTRSCLVLLLLLGLTHPAAAQSDSAWLRVDLGDPATRTSLPPGSIDYGRFAWLPAADAPALLQRQGTRVEQAFHMTLGGRRFDPASGFPASADGWFAPAATDHADFRLVQFHGPIKPEWIAALRGSGVQPVQYVHPFAYIVWAEPAQLQATRALPEVRFGGEFLPAFRVPEASRDSDSRHGQAMALVYRAREADVLAAMAAAGVPVIAAHGMTERLSVVQLQALPERFLDLARIPGVYTVQEITQDAGPRGEMSNQSVVGGYDGSHVIFPGYLDWLTPTGLDGRDVVVGIVDGGIRTSHQDLSDRMVACVSAGGSPTSCTTSNDSHGTHVAGAVAGTGASGIMASGFLRGQGVAPGASLVQQRYSAFISGGGPGGMIPNGMLTIFKESALSGALLTNNSWGPSGTPQGYNIPTMHVDMISRDANPDLPGQQPVLAVWSVMNGNGDSGGACAPSSLGSPDEAKNLLGVGSTKLQNTDGSQIAAIFDVSANSGHGPACDGRLVPHIVAPGCRTDSTSSGSDTAFGLACGTSMASPVVSGAVALFAEQYRNTHGSDPSPALVKAVFTAAARNLVGMRNADNGIMGHRPDRFQGWGRLDLDRVIQPGTEVFLLDQTELFTASGQEWTRTLGPFDPDQPMHIMLAWTDAPGAGTGGTTPAWVNDLDLVVETDAATFLGNVFDSGTGFSASGGVADHRNNLEGVVLSPAQHGGAELTLRVLAANIAADALDPWTPDHGNPRQDFALACINCTTGPDYSLAVTPDAAEICIPDSVSFDIEIGSILGFDEPVDLDVIEAPPGVLTDIGASPLTPPDATTLAVTAPAGVLPGPGTLVLEASSTTGARTRSVALDLFDTAPGAPALQSPADDSSGHPTTLTLEWDAGTQNGSFLVEVASDAGFADIVFDTVTTQTTVQIPTPLATGTRYWWRVHAANACNTASSVTFSFRTAPAPGDCDEGAVAVQLFEEDFNGGAGGFVASGSGAGGWGLSTARPSPLSGGNAFFASNPATISDHRLTSPPIALPADALPITLAFQNWRQIEQRDATRCWDGGILEVSVDGGAFTQIDNAHMLNDPYRGLVQSADGNPLAGLDAWCDDPARPYADTRVDLSAFAGSEIELRWRLGTDSLVGREGWYVDDIRVQSCQISGADLSVDKQVDVSGPGPGDTVVFTITAANAGPMDATGVVVLDLLPDGYQLLGTTVSSGDYDAASGEWSIGDLEQGASAVFTLEASVLGQGEYLNTATIGGDQDDPFPLNNSASATPEPVIPATVFADGFE